MSTLGDSSGLSIYTTPATENQTLTTPAPNDSPMLDDDSMAVDGAVGSSPDTISARRKPRQKAAQPTSPVSPAVPLSSIVYGPDGTVIIEELDSPAIRRAKNIRRKAERLRLEAEASASGVKVDGDDGVDAGSELTSLSEPDSERDRMEVVDDQVMQAEGPDKKEGAEAPEKPGEANATDVDAEGDEDEDADADGEVDEGEVEAENEEARRAEEETIQAEAEVEAAVEANEVDEDAAPEEDKDVAPPEVPQATRTSSRTLLKRRANNVPPTNPDVEPGAVILADGEMLDGGTLSTYLKPTMLNTV